MKKRIVFLMLLIVGLGWAVSGLGGQVKVKIRAVGRDSLPVGYAAMQVHSAIDSASHHFEAATDSAGIAVFTLEKDSAYVIRVQASNYKAAMKNIVVKGDRPLFSIVVESSPNALKDVEIKVKRQLLRQEDDKTIVDPEELAASSTNAYDIIEKVPGLFVDQDGNIYITSATPATVYINGREQKMSNADVAAMLKSLPPNSIEKIEILRTPSARYDASSSGGIVNVVLKKGVRICLTGSVNAGMNQGTYGNQFAGFTLNNNNGVLSTSFNFQASRRATGETLNTDRWMGGDSVFMQRAYTKYPGNNLYGYYSIGYTPNKNFDITYDGRISLNHNNSNSHTGAQIMDNKTGAAAIAYNTDLANRASNINFTQGLSTKYKLDTSGSEWTSDAYYSNVPTTSNQSYATGYTVPLAIALSGNGDVHSSYQFGSFRSDLVRKFPHKLSAEAGIKMTAVWFENNTTYSVTRNGSTVNDAHRTNGYNYQEQILSGYLQASKNLAGLLLKVGGRVENTHMLGHQVKPSDTSFKLNRTDLFPYVFLSRKVMSIASYELRSYLIYRRTISRPAYEYLNPFPKFIDQYLSEMGNPSLRPQFTQNYEANVSVDDRPIVAVGYNEMTEIFSQVIYQADTSSRQTYRTYDNLGTNKELYVKGMGAIPPGKKYFFVIGGQYNHNVYNGQYNGAPLSYSRGGWTFFTYQTLKLGKSSQLVLNGFLRLKGQVQFYELSTFGALNLSLNRHFLDKKLKVTVSVNDMFLTNNNTFTIDQGTTHASGLRKGDTRRFGLNVNYNFGIRKKEEKGFFGEGDNDKL